MGIIVCQCPHPQPGKRPDPVGDDDDNLFK
jgi:hypothetical protein